MMKVLLSILTKQYLKIYIINEERDFFPLFVDNIQIIGKKVER